MEVETWATSVALFLKLLMPIVWSGWPGLLMLVKDATDVKGETSRMVSEGFAQECKKEPKQSQMWPEEGCYHLVSSSCFLLLGITCQVYLWWWPPFLYWAPHNLHCPSSYSCHGVVPFTGATSPWLVVLPHLLAGCWVAAVLKKLEKPRDVGESWRCCRIKHQLH